MLLTTIEPTRPVFARDGVVIAADGALFVDIRSQLLRLSGAGTTVLARLLPLMDGSRTVADLEQALSDVPAAHIRKAIGVLTHHALIETPETEQAGFGPHEHLQSFLRRFARSGDTGADAMRRLNRATIAIVIDDPESEIALQLDTLLMASGVGRVERLASASLLTSTRPQERDQLLVGVAATAEEFDASCEIDHWARDQQVPWLRAVLDRGRSRADIGPFFHPSESPCYRCFARVHLSGDSKVERPSPVRPIGELATFIALLGTELVCRIGRVGDSIGDHSWRRFDLGDVRSTELRFAALPGCARCWPLTDHSAAHADGGELAAVFEGSVTKQSRRDVDAKAGREPVDAGVDFVSQLKQLAALPQCELPDVLLDVLGGGAPSASHACQWDLQTLAAVLRFGVGIRERLADGVKRWSVSGGNLGSCEAYVLAHNVTGLEPGLYFYQPGEHALAKLERRNGSTHDDLMARLLRDPAEQGVDALVIMTGALHRVAPKYGPFGYRLIHFDAGVATSQMQAIAADLNLQIRPTDEWFDEVADAALELEPIDELATTVLMLSRSAGSEASSSDVRPSSLREARGATAPRTLAGLPPYDLLALLVADGRHHPLSHHVARSIALVPLLGETAGPSLLLPEPRSPVMPLAAILEERRSVRHFSCRAVSVDQLSAMLHHAHQTDARDWAGECADGLRLTFTVIARNVASCEQGVYRYVPAQGALVCLKRVSTSNVSDLFVDVEPSLAPVLVWISGPLTIGGAGIGARRYRRLLIRAGAAAHRLSFAATDRGLAGVIIAGIVAEPARRLLMCRGEAATPLIAFACGYEALPAMSAAQG